MLCQPSYLLSSISFLAFMVLAHVYQSQGAIANADFREIANIDSEVEPYSNKWRAEVQDAVTGAGEQLQKNMLFTLTTLATRGIGVTRTGKYLLVKLIIAIINHSFNFAGMVGSLPKILVDDFPTQFVQVLRLMRKEPGLSRDLIGTIDALIEIVVRAQASGVSQFIFKPVTKVIPSLLSGVNRFLVVIFDGVFYLLGARDPYQTVYLNQGKINISRPSNHSRRETYAF